MIKCIQYPADTKIKWDKIPLQLHLDTSSIRRQFIATSVLSLNLPLFLVHWHESQKESLWKQPLTSQFCLQLMNTLQVSRARFCYSPHHRSHHSCTYGTSWYTARGSSSSWGQEPGWELPVWCTRNPVWSNAPYTKNFLYKFSMKYLVKQ